MKKILISVICCMSVLVGCSSIEVDPAANNVIVSPNAPSKKCQYIGQFTGNQGNMFTGGWTSNKNLEQGAMNDLRNQAAKAGANYVQLITSRAGDTGAGGLNTSGYQQTNVTNLGNAYKCPTINND